MEHERRVNKRDITFPTADLYTGLARGAKESEQAYPASIWLLNTLYNSVRNTQDLETWLILATSTLVLQRIDSFMGLSEGDVEFGASRRTAKTTFRNLKGEVKNKTHVVEFE